MKKLLSLILALTLAFALLPTFASAVDMEAAILTPTKFTLDFSKVDTSKLQLSGGSYFLNTAEGSNYIAQGQNGDWCIDNDNSKSTLLRYTSNPVKFYVGTYPKSNYLQLTFNKNRISGANSNPIGDAISFNFTVPVSGYYDVTADIYESIYGGIGNFYIDNKFVCEYDFYNAPTSEDSYGRIYSQEISIGTKSIYLFKGEHTIRIVAEYSSGSSNYAYVMLHSFTFTPATSQINPYVSFVQTTNVVGHNDIIVKSVERGASVALTAHAKVIPGYEFVGWKRGSSVADNSAWVDIDGDSYNVWTNTFLTAIYKPIGETATAATVDFWNQNGAYLGTATEDTYATDVKRVPTLTGFGAFQGWFTDGKVQLTEETELKAGTTNAVAQYEDGVVSGVKYNGNAVAEADTYNEPISLTESGVTYWKRGDTTIAYGDTYNFNVWAGAEITSHTDAVDDKTPVAILEYNDTYKAYMLEYDDGDYEIVEAGILFGGNMTVDNCTNKYTSQRKVSHNQFTVPAEEGTAKGYIIWKNASGAYQIDYFSVAE